MSVGRNSAYNFLGALIPIAVAVVTIPLFIKLIGEERYGVLAIALALLGYLGVFDLGLGRAVSYLLVKERESPPSAQAAIFATALSINAAIGAAGGAILLLIGLAIFQFLPGIDKTIRTEALQALPVLAAGVPVATVTSMCIGALHAKNRFLDTNIVQIISTSLFQLFPLAIAWIWTPALPWLLVGALIARLAGLMMLWNFCRIHVTSGQPVRAAHAYIRPLLTFGGWVTVASMLAPLFGMIDRLTIGAWLGPAQVTAYVVPADLARRLTTIPLALSNALFPRLTAGDAFENRRLSLTATYSLIVLTSLPVFVAIMIMTPLLNIWLGVDLAARSSLVAKILLVGIWINSLAYIPFIQLQARGKPKIIATINAIELPVFAVAVTVGTLWLGIEGAAAAFLARCLADYVLLQAAVDRSAMPVSTIAGHLVLLALAIALSISFEIFSHEWWLVALALGGIIALLDWRLMPNKLRKQLFGLYRRVRGT